MAHVVLTVRGARRVDSGNPWIYRTEVLTPPALEDDTVEVVDQRGRFLASALWAAPPAPIALRIYARSGRHVPFSLELISERIRRAANLRKEVYGDREAYRLVHAEADLIPGLVIDRYGDSFVVQSATRAMDLRKHAVARILDTHFGAKLVVARDDGSLRDHEALPREKGILHGAGETVVRVRMGAATFEQNLLLDAKTGGFLDQVDNHARVGDVARGEALDVFSYHGGFALAMAQRASTVLAVDSDARAIERARRNAELSARGNVVFRLADAFVALRELEGTGRKFDTVVLDPPALAKRSAIPEALRAYHELNLRAFRMMRPDGWLVSCSCSGKITAELFANMLAKAARDARREAIIVEKRGAGPDHPVLLGVPETEYLKCWILRVF